MDDEEDPNADGEDTPNFGVISGMAGSKLDPQQSLLKDQLAAGIKPGALEDSPNVKAATQRATKPYDAYASRLTELRKGAKLSGWDRAVELLAAYGRPSHGTGEALSNMATTAVEQRARMRELKQKYGEVDASNLLESGKAGATAGNRMAELEARQATQLAIAEAKAKGGGGFTVKKVDPLPGGGSSVTGVYGDGRLGNIQLGPGETVQIGQTIQAPAPGGALAPPTAPLTGKFDRTGLPATENVRLTMDQLAKRTGGAQGKAGDGSAVDYNVMTGEIKPVPKRDGISEDDAMKASKGVYRAGYNDENGVFHPYDDKTDRLPTPVEITKQLADNKATWEGNATRITTLNGLQKRIGDLTTGPLGKLASFAPGTPGFDLKESVLTETSAIALDKLRQLKASSPTGASGLGSVTERELALLERSIASLEQAQSPAQFKRHLDTVVQHYQRANELLLEMGRKDATLLRKIERYGKPDAVPGAGDTSDPLGLRG